MGFSRDNALAVAQFGVLALLIAMLPGGAWAALATTNLNTSPTIPWAPLAMALILWPLWRYLHGRWWPSSTSDARARSLRATRVSRQAFAWALVAGTLSIVALAGLWIVFVQLARRPSNPLPDFSKYPFLTVALTIMMASLVTSVAEEAGFRGYIQSLLERQYRGPAAVLIQSLVIAIPHGLTQRFLWSTLLFYFFVDVMLGVTAYLTNSILPGIAIHTMGLLVFFSVVWPRDGTRRVVWGSGADTWFWIHLAQAIVFGVAAIPAFQRLASITAGLRPADHRLTPA
jgi:membrane protease YdiL (CAAX protease family)